MGLMCVCALSISIHAPRKGERPLVGFHYRRPAGFQSTLPARGSDISLISASLIAASISIHAPRKGERPLNFFEIACINLISIHAPRKGERRAHAASWRFGRISIHAPHEGERRSGWAAVSIAAHYFNPRSPRGGATQIVAAWNCDRGFQSTLPARGSDDRRKDKLRGQKISIHAPRKGERRCYGLK